MTNRQKPHSYILSSEFTLNLSWELNSVYTLYILTEIFKCGEDLRIHLFPSSCFISKEKETHWATPPLEPQSQAGEAVSSAVSSEFREPASSARPIHVLVTISFSSLSYDISALSISDLNHQALVFESLGVFFSLVCFVCLDLAIFLTQETGGWANTYLLWLGKNNVMPFSLS